MEKKCLKIPRRVSWAVGDLPPTLADLIIELHHKMAGVQFASISVSIEDGYLILEEIDSYLPDEPNVLPIKGDEYGWLLSRKMPVFNTMVRTVQMAFPRQNFFFIKPFARAEIFGFLRLACGPLPSRL